MPSLDEVLAHFSDRSFLIHIKSNDSREGELLAGYLSKFPAERLNKLALYGGNRPIAAVKAILPNLRVMSKDTLKKSVLSYVAIGWTGLCSALVQTYSDTYAGKIRPLVMGLAGQVFKPHG